MHTFKTYSNHWTWNNQLKINTENTFKYYVKGDQSPGSNILGSQILCTGEEHRFYNDATVTNIIIFHEDVV